MAMFWRLGLMALSLAITAFGSYLLFLVSQGTPSMESIPHSLPWYFILFWANLTLFFVLAMNVRKMRGIISAFVIGFAASCILLLLYESQPDDLEIGGLMFFLLAIGGGVTAFARR